MAQKYSPLKINQELAASLRAIQRATVRDEAARVTLGKLLQCALQLEFATIPTYLSAAFSLKPTNIKIYDLIFRAAIEEMLHMTAVANLMNAIGIAPDIAAAVPEYPHDLTTLDPPLRLNLCSFSLELVEKLFMKIEAPEQRVQFFTEAAARRPETIGQFYAQIIGIIPGLFENAKRDKYKQIQVRPNFKEIAYASNQDNEKYPLKPYLDFMIEDPDSAVRHLSWVVDQGEGEDVYQPLTAEGIPGHHYRFESILRKRYLIKDKSAEKGYSFSGGDLPFDPDGVYDFETNAKTKNYIGPVREEMQFFNENYTQMINLLQRAFNCPSPEQEQQSKAAAESAIDNMRSMQGLATAIVGSAQSSGIKAGIPFEYGGPPTS
jgi:Ferritin-like